MAVQGTPRGPIPDPVLDLDPGPENPPPPGGLADRVQAAAAMHAEAPCTWCGGETLSFAQVARRAGRLIERLQRVDVGPEARVIICLPRSADLVIAVHAVIRAGAVFVLIPPDDPPARIALQIEDLDAAAIVTDPGTAVRLNTGATPVVGVEDLDGADAEPALADLCTRRDDPEAPAYIAYTSGSTGRPKGAINTQAGILNFLDWMSRDLPIGVGDGILQRTTIGFDVAVPEFLWPFVTGARIVLPPPQAQQDQAALARLMAEQDVTVVNFVPSTLREFLALPDLPPLPRLRRAIVIGEILPMELVRRFHERFATVQLENQYGPAECAVAVTRWMTSPDHPGSVAPIGRAFRNVSIHVVNADLMPVDPCTEGEILIGGVQVGAGYWRRPEVTAERFIEGARPGLPPGRYYRTGDIGRVEPDGRILCLGRTDGQVKINGVRIEIGEVEAALVTHPDIAAAAVVAQPRPDGSGKRLVAWAQPHPGHAVPSAERVRADLAAVLARAVMPALVLPIEALPRLPNGKVDRKALPAPPTGREGLGTDYVAPAAGAEARIAAVWADLLGVEQVGALDGFFALGGSSLQAARMIARVNTALGIALPVTTAFTHRTPAALAEAAEAATARAGVASPGAIPTDDAAPTPDAERESATGAIAIVGAAGRFPGADTVKALWDALLAGVDGMTRFAPEALHRSVAAEAASPAYVPVRGVLADPFGFDPAFFGMTRRDATMTDPQQRVLLECCWEVLDAAGYAAEPPAAPIGVYLGVGEPSYWLDMVAHRPDAVAAYGALPTAFSNDKDYVATRVAHRLNLTGPALTVQTACSTSLTSVAVAVDALRHGHCAMAIAGGLTVRVPGNVGHVHQEGAMLSADGRCRPFDADSTGTLFNDGGGVVLLKPLAAAERDGDPVLGVILGVGVTNDGADKASFSAPSVSGQAAALRRALADAGVPADSIGYVEAHGTGTPIGDPIETAALAEAYDLRPERPEPLRIGSVKGNVGHLVAGAGVAGLIKTAYALHTGTLPATLHFDRLNPGVDDHGGILTVVDRPTPWPRGPQPRRAGVTSLGVGGTNVHVIVEEGPRPAVPPPIPVPMLTLSARTPESLAVLAAALAGRVRQADGAAEDLADLLVAQHRRVAHAARLAVPAPDAATAIAALTDPGHPDRIAGSAPVRPRPMAFLLTGQGSQYLGMARPMAQQFPVFAVALEAALDAIPEADTREAVRACLLDPPPDDEVAGDGQGSDSRSRGRFTDTALAQPALAAVEVAMARLLETAGLRADLYIGHSLGELVAAHLSGVMSLDALMTVVSRRAAMMHALPSGRMMAVRAPADAVAPHLGDDVAIAAVNEPQQVVIAGEVAAVEAAAGRLEAAGIAAQPIHTSHAFHSPMVDPVIPPFTEVMAAVELAPPTTPILSTVTGADLTAAEATDPAFWGAHARRTVNFSGAVDALLARGPHDVVEIGPRGVLIGMARRLRAEDWRLLPALGRRAGEEVSGYAAALAALWVAGQRVDWRRADGPGLRRPVSGLPSYPWQKVPCRIEAGAPGAAPTVAPAVSDPAPSPAPSPPDAASAAAVSAPPAGEGGPDAVRSAVRALLTEVSGEPVGAQDDDRPFLDIGFDSLMLTQLGIAVRKAFGVTVGQRAWLDEARTPGGLADLIVRLGGAVAAAAAEGTPPASAPTPTSPSAPTPPSAADVPAPAAAPERRPFGAMVRISTGLARRPTARQRHHIDALIARTVARTPASKANAARHRDGLADPRTVAGFNPLYKEMVYPILVDRSEGAWMWDVDGNRYVDMFGGFGANILGHRPPDVVAAIAGQLDRGFEIGPMHPLVGEAADLFRRLTGMERVTFCTTGSEAVAGAVRACRTITGRDTIVTFSHAYHGIFDEVIVRTGPDGRPRAGAPGIPGAKVAEVIVMDYGTDESLERIRALGDRIAAVLVEPVQSRQLDLVPRTFLQELRGITERIGAALLFDEVITGFRAAPGGAQEYFGIRADIATYGKILGGGLPCAAIAGRARFMDAFDGGTWQYGDDSGPGTGVTYFAGTMVRHPLSMVAAKAVLERLLKEGPAFQATLTERTARVVEAIRTAVAYVGAPLRVPSFSSAFRVEIENAAPWVDLLFYHLRLRGVFIQEDRTWFLTAAHSDADLALVTDAVRDSLLEMAADGLFDTPTGLDARRPPVPGARLGTDPAGHPGWFVPDPARPGRWRQLPAAAPGGDAHHA